MSEPMTSGEIEDVLSSIRKLVSEDFRPQARAVEPPPEPPEAGKLILTAALRVAEGSAEAEATLAAMPEAEPTHRLRLDTVVSTFAARISPPAEGWEAEIGDAAVTRLVRTPPPVDEPEAAVEPFPDAATADDAAMVPDEAGTEPYAGLHFAWQSRRAGQGDPREDFGDDKAMKAASDSLPEADEDAEAPMRDLDQVALTELVRDVLREELHGALGERMTRNIRKLVRAEVARALATRDLA